MNTGRLGGPAMVTGFQRLPWPLGLAVFCLLKASSGHTWPTSAGCWSLSEVRFTDPASGCTHSQCAVKETSSPVSAQEQYTSIFAVFPSLSQGRWVWTEHLQLLSSNRPAG